MDNVERFMWYLTSAFALLSITLIRYLHNNETESLKDEITHLKAEVEASKGEKERVDTVNNCYDCKWMQYRGWLFWRSLSCSNSLIALYEVPVEKIRDNCPMFEKKEFAQPRQNMKPVPVLPPRSSVPSKPTPTHE